LTNQSGNRRLPLHCYTMAYNAIACREIVLGHNVSPMLRRLGRSVTYEKITYSLSE